MKKIQSVPIWQNGSVIEATFLSATAQDNLSDAASVYYTLYSGSEWPEQSVLNSSVAIGGEDYQNWDADPDMNTWLYNWLAEKLNITIVGDYIPKPDPTVIIETTDTGVSE